MNIYTNTTTKLIRNIGISGILFGAVLTSSIITHAGVDHKHDDLPHHHHAEIGNYVWEDTNHNGIQDADEAGVPNVTVHIKGLEKDNWDNTTTTNEFGYYKFDELVEGEFEVSVDLPEGYEFTKQFAGKDKSKDSNIDPLTNTSEWISLTDAETNNTISAGITKIHTKEETKVVATEKNVETDSEEPIADKQEAKLDEPKQIEEKEETKSEITLTEEKNEKVSVADIAVETKETEPTPVVEVEPLPAPKDLPRTGGTNNNAVTYLGGAIIALVGFGAKRKLKIN